MNNAFAWLGALVIGLEQPTAADFLAIIEAASSGIKDATFIYEVKAEAFVERDKNYVTVNHFSANASYLADGSVHWKLFAEDRKSRSIITASATPNGLYTETRLVEDGQTNGHNVKSQIERPIDRIGISLGNSFGRFWFPVATKYFDERLRNRITVEGNREIDGRNCFLVSVSAAPGNGTVPQQAERHWIDIERGANALRSEFTRNGQIVRTQACSLQSVRGKDDKEYWFPRRSYEESFGRLTTGGKDESGKLTNIWKMTNYPTHRRTTIVVEGSVVINGGVNRESMRVQLDKNVVTVTPQLLRKIADQGVQRATIGGRVTVDEMKRSLREGERQIDAMQTRRMGPSISWMSVVGVVCAVLGLGGLIVALYLRR